MRVTVGTIVGLLASGHSVEEVLEAYPYLEKEDVNAALSYAAWRAEEVTPERACAFEIENFYVNDTDLVEFPHRMFSLQD